MVVSSTMLEKNSKIEPLSYIIQILQHRHTRTHMHTQINSSGKDNLKIRPETINLRIKITCSGLYWASFLSSWHKIESSGKKETHLRKCPQQNGTWGIFLIHDWYRKVQLTVGGASLGLVVLDALRKQAVLWDV